MLSLRHGVFVSLAVACFSAADAFAPAFNVVPSSQGSFVSAGLKNADKIGKPIPGNWKQGQQFVMGEKLAVGDLVFVTRSDGSKRYGEIVAAAGLPWQDQWEVCVQAEGNEAGACRVELAKDIGKVVVGGTTAASPAAGSMLIGRGGSAPVQRSAPAARRGAAAGRAVGTARVGSQRVSVGSQRATPRQQPPKPAPKKISLVARPPPAKPAPKPAQAPAPRPARGGRAAAVDKAAGSGKTAVDKLPFADKLSRAVPETWEEGAQYQAAEEVDLKSLVVVDTATGLKFGVPVAKTGFFWQQNYKVVTAVTPAGAAAGSEEVPLQRIFVPSPAALAELDQPVAAVGGFLSGLFKSFGGKEEPKPAFPKPAAKPPAAPGGAGGALGSIAGRLGSLLPETNQKEEAKAKGKVEKDSKPKSTDAKPEAKAKAKAAGAVEGLSGRVGSMAVVAESAADAGRGVALGLLNGLSKVLGDDNTKPKTSPPPAEPKAKAPAAPPAPAPATPKEPKAAAPAKEAKKVEEKKEETMEKKEKKEKESKTEATAAAPAKKEEAKPASAATQPPPPGLGLAVPLAKQNALEENLRRAERPGDLNLGLGPEWEDWKPKED